MRKDKDWLSQQVGDLNSANAIFDENGISYIDTAVSIERVFDLIYQLDDPEILTQEWVDEHAEIGGRREEVKIRVKVILKDEYWCEVTVADANIKELGNEYARALSRKDKTITLSDERSSTVIPVDRILCIRLEEAQDD